VDLGDGDAEAFSNFHACSLASSVLQRISLVVPIDDLSCVELCLVLPHLDHGHIQLLLDVHSLVQIIGHEGLSQVRLVNEASLQAFSDDPVDGLH